jgi:hypothetical protein
MLFRVTFTSCPTAQLTEEIIMSRIFAIALALSSTLLCTPTASALHISINGGRPVTKTIAVAAAPGATGDACAYSQVATTSNATTSGNVIQEGQSRNFTLNKCDVRVPPIPATFTTRLAEEITRIFRTVPGVGDLNRPKLPLPKLVQVNSTTSARGKTASATGQWDTLNAGVANLSVAASISGNKQPFALAAALAEDPFNVAPGTYDYSPTIDTIMLTNDDESGLAVLDFSAQSSLVGTDGKLWDLILVLYGDGDFNIGFFAADLLNLDESVVIQNVLSALDFSSPNTIKLGSHFTLFNSTLSSNDEFLVSESIRGYVENIPEPGTLKLATLGLVLLNIISYSRLKMGRAPGAGAKGAASKWMRGWSRKVFRSRPTEARRQLPERQQAEDVGEAEAVSSVLISITLQSPARTTAIAAVAHLPCLS